MFDPARVGVHGEVETGGAEAAAAAATHEVELHTYSTSSTMEKGE